MKRSLIKLNKETPVQDEYLDKMFELAQEVQKEVTEKISSIDGSTFQIVKRDLSTPDNKINSRCHLALLEHSQLFEKASFTFSDNWGKFTKMEGNTPKEYAYHATDFNLEIHPNKPLPSTRIHYHFIKQEGGFYAFAGGASLMPIYIIEEDIKKFHQYHKEACDKYLGEGWYPRFKKSADEYYYIPHRGYNLGVGGTFFENLNENGCGKEKFNTGISKENIFQFIQASSKIINDAYSTIIEKRQNLSFNEKQIDFMEKIRSRYTEFNLVLDRGIIFGLKLGMPADLLLPLPRSNWEFEWEKKYSSNTEEYKTLESFKKPREWV